MSLAAESPLHSSSSSDDFAALLEQDLEVDSSFSESPGRKGGADIRVADREFDVEEEEDDDRDEARKKRKLESIGLTMESVSGMVQEKDNELPSKKTSGCLHSTRIKGLCVNCGSFEEDDGCGVAIGYIHKDLKVHATEIDRLRKVDLKNMMLKKKLILVLDLDHTLLNSTQLGDISPEEGYLLQEAEMVKGDPKRSLFKLDSMHLMTKLRPYVHFFLSEAHKMYDLYIYTMGERCYAQEMARILDPGGMYFNSKVICHSDSTRRHQKGLDVVLGAESTVLILDDTEAVWQRHKENLILMERYHYFASSCRQFNSIKESLSVAKKDESETDGILASILRVLERIHRVFFDVGAGVDLSNRDVRMVLRNVRREILQGCKVVFSRLFPSESPAENQPIWKMCEHLGAMCCTEVDSSITHVISNDKGTQKARWAVQNDKFLVNPGWVEGAHYLWRRMPEKEYPVSNPKN